MKSRRIRGLTAVVSMATAVLAVAACSPSTEPTQKPIASPGSPLPAPSSSGTSSPTARPRPSQGVVDDFEANYPKIKVVVKYGQDDDKMTQAIGAGSGPDVGLSYSTDIVGKFCSPGAWVDLGPYIERDKVDLNKIPATVRVYTEYEGKRCTMPFLADAYGLYYNKDMFAAAGITDPPKTLDRADRRRQEADQAATPTAPSRWPASCPLFGFYENSPAHFAPMVGAKWLNDDGKSAIGGDPAWQDAADLAEGPGRLVRLRQAGRSSSAGLGDEFSADNAFQKGTGRHEHRR